MTTIACAVSWRNTKSFATWLPSCTTRAKSLPRAAAQRVTNGLKSILTEWWSPVKRTTSVFLNLSRPARRKARTQSRQQRSFPILFSQSVKIWLALLIHLRIPTLSLLDPFDPYDVWPNSSMWLLTWWAWWLVSCESRVGYIDSLWLVRSFWNLKFDCQRRLAQGPTFLLQTTSWIRTFLIKTPRVICWACHMSRSCLDYCVDLFSILFGPCFEHRQNLCWYYLLLLLHMFWNMVLLITLFRLVSNMCWACVVFCVYLLGRDMLGHLLAHVLNSFGCVSGLFEHVLNIV